MNNNDLFRELHLMKYNLFKEQNVENGLFDVTFEIEGKLLYAHKNMLNLVSPTFASMLSDRWNSNKDGSIKIKDYNYDDFYKFITFLYSAQCELNDTNIYTMVDVAEFYGVELFKKYCDQFLAAMTKTTENVFKLMELAEKYSLIQFKSSLHNYITTNFTPIIKSDEFIKVAKPLIKELIVAHKYKADPEDIFQAIYKWCEVQAANKQGADPNGNLQEAIKEEISDFLPLIDFRRMESKFMHEYILPRGFIFSSYDKLSQIFCDREHFFEGNIKVTNHRGETLHGNVIPEKTILTDIESLKLLTCDFGIDTYCFWNTKCKLPSTPSPLKKRDEIEWYLVCFNCSRNLGVISRKADRLAEYYLLAELTPGESGFQTASGCKIEI